MRDAFGGAFMIQIFLVFIFVYICFTSIALNYAKAFKVKTAVIEYLESNEITSVVNLSSSELDAIENYFESEILTKLNYKVNESNFCAIANYDPDKDKCFEIGILIINNGIPEEANAEQQEEQKNIPLSLNKGTYYTVHTYVGWGTGFLKSLSLLNGNNREQASVNGYWTISGETRVIYGK